MTAIIGDFKISSLVCFCLNAVKSYTIYFKIMETGSYQKVIKGLSKSYQKVIGENINPGRPAELDKEVSTSQCHKNRY